MIRNLGVLALPLLLAGCSSMAASGPRPATTAVSAYEACVLKGVAAQPKSVSGRVATAEAGCQAEILAYRKQYEALGISADVTEKAIQRVVESTRTKAKTAA
jgi:hypothetical protein